MWRERENRKIYESRSANDFRSQWIGPTLIYVMSVCSGLMGGFLKFLFG